MENMIVRGATDDDYKAIERFEMEQQKRNTLPLVEIEDITNRVRAGDYIIAVEDNRIIGLATICDMSGDLFFIDWFSIHPDFRKKGNGRNLMKGITEFADFCGKSLELSVAQTNEPAIRVYRSNGFTHVQSKGQHQDHFGKMARPKRQLAPRI